MPALIRLRQKNGKEKPEKILGGADKKNHIAKKREVIIGNGISKMVVKEEITILK